MVRNNIPLFRRSFTAVTNPDRSVSQKLLTLVRLFIELYQKSIRLRLMVKPEPVRFSGWGMSSEMALPWDSTESTQDSGLSFAIANRKLLQQIESNLFVLSQFKRGNHYIQKPSNLLTSLSWRHYVVYWSAKFSIRFTSVSKYNFVEAGVCDGLTISFAISAIKDEGVKDLNFEMFLYDAWGAMKPDLLTTGEMHLKGNYDYLDLDQTKLNLNQVIDRCKFIKGYIPEVFDQDPGPNQLSWLHIDLNSSMPTQKTLEHFLPRMVSGGIVLFDDYGHNGYHETRKIADELCVDGLLFPLPTGQAIFFKH